MITGRGKSINVFKFVCLPSYPRKTLVRQAYQTIFRCFAKWRASFFHEQMAKALNVFKDWLVKDAVERDKEGKQKSLQKQQMIFMFQKILVFLLIRKWHTVSDRRHFTINQSAGANPAVASCTSPQRQSFSSDTLGWYFQFVIRKKMSMKALISVK